jgi:hypothetical protein
MGKISVTDPVNLAIERVRQLLFRSFDLSRWFAIGFCAWLAYLGEQGFRGNSGSGFNSNNHGGDFRQQWDHTHDFLRDNLYWILPVAVVAIAIVLILWMVFLWLNSRGKFMFLYCVALNRAEVREPWNRFAGAAMSLFWFRLLLGFIGMVIMLAIITATVLSLLPMILHNAWSFVGFMPVIALVLTMIVVGIFFGLIRKLTLDFVVPIMFLRGRPCLNAWGEFWQLLAANFGEFVLYFLFQILIGLVIGVIVLFVVLVTCCIAGCLLAIPYIGTVLFLPVLVFKRAYSLYYLAQYGPTYNVFPPAVPPAY